MAVSEALEIQDGLGARLQRELDAVIVNGMLPRRFSDAELAELTALSESEPAGSQPTPALVHGAASSRARPARAQSEAALVRSATHAARSVHERARRQHNQLARLRRRSLPVLSMPFVFAAELDLAILRQLADQLSRKL